MIPPAQVVIKDAAGVIIKVALVGAPFRTQSGQFAFCTYPITAELPDGPAYTFIADDEPPQTVGRDELAQMNWKLVLTVMR